MLLSLIVIHLLAMFQVQAAGGAAAGGAGRAAAGRGVTDCVKVTLYMTASSKFAAVNKWYAAFVGGHRPARTRIGVSALPLGAKIEIDVIAAQ